jgi:NAD+ diphosphatase
VAADRTDAPAPAPIAFAGATLDRAPHLRGEERRLRDLDTSRVVLVGADQRLAVLVPGQQPARAAPRTLERLPIGALPAATPLTFLGLEPPDGAAVFAADALDLHTKPAHTFAPLRELMAELDPAEAALSAYAVGMVGWHRVHRHCGRCGHATEIESGGHRRSCPHCALVHFPRTDPAVTMLVQDADRCLLSRRHGAPEHRWSALAGFVEPGETLEEAVRREAREETGVEVTAVEFVAAQPWPFPAALMIGFWAFADPGAAGRALEPDPGELVEARWFERTELSEALTDTQIILPPAGSIGNYLITTWLGRV